MNKTFTIEELAAWIQYLKDAAKVDTTDKVFWFEGTEGMAYQIVGGWSEGFSEDYADVFCLSESEPWKAMCIKIAEHKDALKPTDFDFIDEPVNSVGEVEGCCVPLEWDDTPVVAAAFYTIEWERLMAEKFSK